MRLGEQTKNSDLCSWPLADRRYAHCLDLGLSLSGRLTAGLKRELTESASIRNRIQFDHLDHELRSTVVGRP